MNKKQSFDDRIRNIPQSILNMLSKIDQFQGQWTFGAKLSPQVLGRLKRSTLVTSTGSSTRIEGAKLSDEDVEKLMQGLDIQKFQNRDKQEVKGYFELLNNVFDSWNQIIFNENTIKHFHKELLKYVDKDKCHRGDYKKRENKVHMINANGESVGILFDTIDAYLTPKAMQELVEWTQIALDDRKYHPLLIIANFLVEFLRIHPFQDGNGRLSRIMTNLLLLKYEYSYAPYVSHEKLVEDNKPEYYIALRKSQNSFGTKKENIIPWLEFFLNIILDQSKSAISLLSKENLERLLTKKQYAVWEFLKKGNISSPLEINNATGVAYATVRQTLNKLLKLNLIERIGQGRSTRYRIYN